VGVRFQRASAEAVAEAEKSMSGGGELRVPTDARADRKNIGWFYWPENVKIVDATALVTQTQNKDEHVAIEVSTLITAARPDGTVSENVDRKVSLKTRLNWDAWGKFSAMSEGEKAAVLRESGPGTFGGQVKMHRGSVARIAQLLRVAGLYEGGDIDLPLWDHVFPEQGLSPLAGFEMGVDVKQGPNDKGDKWPEIAKILVPDNIALPTEAAVSNGALTL
jgi:hypothetical protein